MDLLLWKRESVMNFNGKKILMTKCCYLHNIKFYLLTISTYTINTVLNHSRIVKWSIETQRYYHPSIAKVQYAESPKWNRL